MTFRSAPGVYTSVKQLIGEVTALPSTEGFVAIISEKGPDNQFVKISAEDYISIFGEPSLSYTRSRQFGFGPYIATSFLSESDNLNVIRILPWDDSDPTMESATYSNLVITCEDVADEDTEATISTTNAEDQKNESNIETLVSTNDNTDGSPNNLVVIYGLGRGEYYNNYQINLRKSADQSIAEEQIYVLDVFQLQTHNMAEETSSENLTMVASFEVSMDPDARNDFGDSIFIEDVINNNFDDLQCVTDQEFLKDLVTRYFDALEDYDTEFELDFSTPFYDFLDSDTLEINLDNVMGVPLDEGSSGNLFDSDGKVNSEIATNLLVRAYNGTLRSSKTSSEEHVDEILDKENYIIDVIFDAGYPSDVKFAIQNTANSRKDCLAVLDNGDTRSFTELKENREDTHTYNNRYAAMYEPYSKIYDPWTARDVWITPTFHLANIIPFTDNNFDPWYDPAGSERGGIAAIKELRYYLNRSQRDWCSLHQVNPIVRFDAGYKVFDNKTMQNRSGPLQFIGILRTMIFIKRSLKAYCDGFILNELVSDETKERLSQGITEFLRRIEERGGLYSYTVQVNANEADRRAGRIKVDVDLEIVRGLRQIHLNFFVK